MGRGVSIVLDIWLFLSCCSAINLLLLRLASIDHTLHHLSILILDSFFLCIRLPFTLLLEYLVFHVSLNDMVDFALL